MIAELRAGFLFFVSRAFFLNILFIILAIFILSIAMRPDRWSERSRAGSVGKVTAGGGLSTAV
jgi:hypothetical protein